TDGSKAAQFDVSDHRTLLCACCMALVQVSIKRPAVQTATAMSADKMSARVFSFIPHPLATRDQCRPLKCDRQRRKCAVHCVRESWRPAASFECIHDSTRHRPCPTPQDSKAPRLPLQPLSGFVATSPCRSRQMRRYGLERHGQARESMFFLSLAPADLSQSVS